LIAETLVRELEVDWPLVEVILPLQVELATARAHIVELEAEPAKTNKNG
jgi:hypothetical protein